LEIPIIHRKRQLVPKPEVLLFTKRKILTETGTSQGHVQKGLQECLYITTMVSPGPLSPTASASSPMKTLENTEQDPDSPELADEGDIQLKDSSAWLHNPSIGSVTKNYLEEIRSVLVLLIIHTCPAPHKSD
jgi:hypothetical protein